MLSKIMDYKIIEYAWNFLHYNMCRKKQFILLHVSPKKTPKGRHAGLEAEKTAATGDVRT